MNKLAITASLFFLFSLSLFANPVDVNTAQKVAENFMQAQTGQRSTLRVIEYADRAEFANFYVFGTETSFVIVAADDCVQPILGYSTENPFGREKMPENVKGWLKDYEYYIDETVKSGKKAETHVEKEWKQLVDGTLATKRNENPTYLIKTQWNQRDPYNRQCPGTNTATGCVATAMAQIMKYWNYPSTGFSSHSYSPTTHPEYGVQTVNYGEAFYDWDNMIDSYSSSSPEEQANAVAKLMYHCGVAVNMDYGSSSSAVTEDVVYALQTYFNYRPTAEYIVRADYVDENGEENLEQWKNLLKAELTATPPRPIQYRGNKKGTGHSFICDGYDETNGKFHFNWGWSGNGDGWFDITGLSSYPNNHGAIIGIQPITYNIQASGLTATVERHNISLTWDEVPNVSSYNVYRNHTLIGNAENTTFVDSDLPLGEYFYYVRCVDSEGNVSLPSNIETATIETEFTLDDLTIEHLEGNYNNNTVTLQWEAPYRLNYIDHYLYNDVVYYTGYGEPHIFCWGARFLSSMLSEGTSLTSISTYFYTSGDFSAEVYQCTGGVPSGEPIATVPTHHYPSGWTTLSIANTALDHNKDLWVIFKSTDLSAPTIVAPLSTENGNYYSVNGTNWYHFNPGYSFFVTAGLTNGDFSFTLYDNGESVQDNISTSAIILPNVATNTAHQYTVKALMGNEQTPASNMVGLTLGTASLSSLELGENDKMTITAGSKLTVSETLTNTDPANLILENGAELVHNTAGVKATVKKTITSPSNDDHGWYFIASPIAENITPSEENGFLNGTAESNTYDLYYYDEPDQKWMNHENSAFSLMPQKGYLYANEDGTTLQFAGTLTPSNSSVTISNLSHSASPLNGFNLVGNPFACNATVDKDFYVVDNATGMVVLASNTAEIAPCAGIFVKASEQDASVTFTKAASRVEPSSSSFDIVVKRAAQPTRDGVATGSTTLDRARVRLGDTETLEKFSIGDGEGSVIYFPQDGQDLAVACTNGQNEMPLNFKATENGTYTLSFEVDIVDLDYLHLIDNMTGDEIDVLAMPTYTFEAKTTDYASRFRLVFSMLADGPSADEQPFAY